LRPHAVLVLVGDGPCREEIRSIAGGLAEEERVRFTGAVPSSDVHEWVQIADVFALVSSLEGLPVSLIEAMATGLPVVVSDISANRQLVDHGVEGMVVEAKNEDAIGSALGAILDNPETRRQMGEAARSRIGDRFSTARVTVLYETLFARLLGWGDAMTAPGEAASGTQK
jgi:glycosyltransferase involved in cell wall biosynthesis